jgi:hypothetical protein
MGQTIDRSEAGFDSRRHQIADVVALITLGYGDEADRLAVVAVEREGDADLLAIVAAELEAARTLAAVCRGGAPRCSTGPRQAPTQAYQHPFEA